LPILPRSARGHGSTPHPAAGAGLQADALRVPWHRGIAAQTAFAAPRERVALPMLGCPLRVHRVDADSAARHAETTGNVC
jgi:hypothetical protein